MKRVILLLLLCCALLQGFAQVERIKCSMERNADNSLTLWVENNTPIEYSMVLSFPSLSGYSSTVNSGSVIRVAPGRTHAARLTREKTAINYSANFVFRPYPGKAFLNKPGTDILYLLPAPEGTHLQTIPVNSVAQQLGQDTLNDYHAIGFNYQIGDTICAARAGIVYMTNDKIVTPEEQSRLYDGHRNGISIQHRDGTLAQYTILAPIKLLVEVGAEVVPGQPLAIFDREAIKFMVLFGVAYLDEREAKAIGFGREKLSPYHTLPTVFHAAETEGLLFSFQQYTAAHPKEIIGKELSKREKKKLGF